MLRSHAGFNQVSFELSIIGSKTTIFTCCPILLVAFSFLFHEYHVHGSIIHNFR